MKLRLRNLTLGHYLRHVRRQPLHVQHVHAFVFAGLVTASLGALILHADYGLWRERYIKEEIVVVEEEEVFPESPSEALSRFFKEAGERFGAIGSSGSELLEGREVYKKEE